MAIFRIVPSPLPPLDLSGHRLEAKESKYKCIM